MPTYTGTITVELPFSVALDIDEELNDSEVQQLALEQNNCPADAVVVDLCIDEPDEDDEEEEGIDADEEDLLDDEEE
jgi:hypothetical protein